MKSMEVSYLGTDRCNLAEGSLFSFFILIFYNTWSSCVGKEARCQGNLMVDPMIQHRGGRCLQTPDAVDAIFRDD